LTNWVRVIILVAKQKNQNCLIWLMDLVKKQGGSGRFQTRKVYKRFKCKGIIVEALKEYLRMKKRVEGVNKK